jgi:magnesium transporter
MMTVRFVAIADELIGARLNQTSAQAWFELSSRIVATCSRAFRRPQIASAPSRRQCNAFDDATAREPAAGGTDRQSSAAIWPETRARPLAFHPLGRGPRPPIWFTILKAMNDTNQTAKDQPTPAATLADQLERLPEDEAQEVFRQLTAAQSAAVVAELEPADAAKLVAVLPNDRVAACLELLPRTIATDLLGDFPEPRRAQILSLLPAEKAAVVSSLLRYPAESAGGIMDSRFVAVRAGETIEESLSRIRTAPVRPADDVAYIYVTDEAQKLVGVVSLRDLIFSSAGRRVGEIMNPDVRFLRVSDDQEEIARLIRHTNFRGFPVVDAQQQLVGVVRMRDAIRVAQTEATEDMQLMVGLSGEERIWTRWNTAVAKRLPWLGVNMLTTLLAAAVISLFEETIARWAALVVFLPMISAVGGNAGMQTLTIIVRGLALGDVTPGDALRAVRKELAIGLVNGIALGFMIGLLAFGWKGSLVLGAVSGAAMLLNQMVGTLSGVAVPFGLRKCGVDPALASSIFVTTITDVIGFLAFLGLAAMAMGKLG